MRVGKKFLIGFVGWLSLITALPDLCLSQDVISFFAAPGSGAASGLTWDGVHLWSASVDPDMSVLYEVDTLGNVISSFSWSGLAAGLAFDGVNLWASTAISGVLYKFSKSGALLSQLSTSLTGISGITWDGSNLWAVDLPTTTVNKLDASGNIITSFPVPCFNCLLTGLAFDGNTLWVSDAFTNSILQFSTAGALLQEFSGPGLSATELEWDGDHLWVSDLVTDRIYKLKVTSAEEVVGAKVEFRPRRWPLAWSDADRKPSCDSLGEDDDDDDDDDGDDDGDDDDDDDGDDGLGYWGGGMSFEDVEKLSCKRKVKCYIGNLNLDSVTFDVEEILIGTVRANDLVPVLMKKDCDDDMSLSAGLDSPPEPSCFDAKIYSHRDRFEGRVLRVRFDATELFKTLGPVEAGDTVQVCVTGELKNGMKFKGCAYIVIVGDHPTDVDPGQDGNLPKGFALKGNFPNPFNASTTLRFALTKTSRVELSVYNILGQKVTTLVDQTMLPGDKQVIWNGTDQNGRQMGTGIYFYRLVTEDGTETGKMTMLK